MQVTTDIKQAVPISETHNLGDHMSAIGDHMSARDLEHLKLDKTRPLES